MRTVLISGLLMLAIAFQAKGQVSEETRTMNLGTNPALIVSLPGADTKLADNQWAEYVKAYGKIENVKKAKEKVIRGIQVIEVSRDTKLDIYTLSEAMGKDARMVVWMKMDNGFVSSKGTPDAYAGAVQFLANYAHKVRISQAEGSVADQQKELEKLKNDLAKLQKENTSLHKDIENYNKKIEEAEKKDIPNNLKEQESTKSAIGRLQISTLGEKEQKELSKQMKNLEKLTKENERLHKSIEDNQDRIKKAERDIEKNLNDQEKAKKDIEEQEKVVSGAQKNLMDVKSDKPK